MKALVKRFFDIREGEGLNALLMFSGIFLIIASLLIIKPVSNSLFLTRFGVEKLPNVFILTAFFAGIIAFVYTKFAKSIRLSILIISSFAISITGLFIFWILFHFQYDWSWFIYAFYIWVALSGIIISSQFWLLANNIFNARQAKRLFGFIGVGGISGGIFGGYLTNFLAAQLRTENLIFFSIGFLFICVFLLMLAWKRKPHYSIREKDNKYKLTSRAEAVDNPIKLILKSRHLIYLSSLMGVGVIVANFVDYQFSAVALETFDNQDQLTAFFGFWLSNLNIISLAIQLFITGRIMKHFGIGTSLLILPASILIGAVAILVNPGLITAIFIKICDGGFKHSINKTGIEVLALPIPQKIKIKAKTFIDVVVNNLAAGIAGILLIIITTFWGFSINQISLLIIGFIAVWIYLVFRARSEYVNSFRQAIEKRTIDINQQSLNLDDALIFKSFINVLDSGNDRQILYILKLLEDVNNNELIPYLKILITHPSDEIKSIVLKMIRQYEEPDLSEQVKNLVSNTNQIVQIESIRYLYKRSDDGIKALEYYLSHDDFRIRCAAVICAAGEWKHNKQFRKTIDIKDLIENLMAIYIGNDNNIREQYAKTSIAKAIGIARNPELYHYLVDLLCDENLVVVRSSIYAAGLARTGDFIPKLISFLSIRQFRLLAREALAEYGEDSIDILAKHLLNSKNDIKIRLEIPKVLALIDSPKAVNVLIGNLHQKDLKLRYEILKALNKLKAKFPILKFDKQILKARIIDEIKDYHKIRTVLHHLDKTLNAKIWSSKADDNISRKVKALKLLIKALNENLEINLERIFRLMGLKYIPKDMYYAYLGVVSSKQILKVNAVEFLDNILDLDLKKIVIPIIERSSSESAANMIRRFDNKISSEAESVKTLLLGENVWLKACSLYYITETDSKSYDNIIEILADDSNLMVREMVSYYFDRD